MPMFFLHATFQSCQMHQVNIQLLWYLVHHFFWVWGVPSWTSCIGWIWVEGFCEIRGVDASKSSKSEPSSKFWNLWIPYLLLLDGEEKSHSQPPFGCIKPVVNNGINYLSLNWWMSDFIHQQLANRFEFLWRSERSVVPYHPGFMPSSLQVVDQINTVLRVLKQKCLK